MRRPPPPVLDEQTDLAATCEILGITFEDLRAELARREAEKFAKMRKEMILAQRGGGVRRMLDDRGEGGGFVEYMVHPVSYHYWGRRLGYECWDDKSFVREYLRDNPAARVKSMSNRTTVTVAGPVAAAARPAPVPTHQRINGRGRWSA